MPLDRRGGAWQRPTFFRKLASPLLPEMIIFTEGSCGISRPIFVKKITNTQPNQYQAPSPPKKKVPFIDRVWRFVVSLKCGILLLATIGAVAIWGTTTIAANDSLGDNAITIARSHVFESWWFVALLLLFAIQLILSTWHVTIMSFTIWWKRQFRSSPDYYKYGSSPRAEIPVTGDIEEAEKFIALRFTRSHRDGNLFFAHKGILSRFGPTIVHIGILTVIFSQVIRVMLIWSGGVISEGRFIGGEGERTAMIFEPLTTEQQLSGQNIRPFPIPFWITVLDFDEINHPNSNVPAYFSSLIKVEDPRTQEVTYAQLDMNHSFARDGLEFHQAGYTPLPPDRFQRFNFDVRNRLINERIAITDTHPFNRVRIGDTENFLEVDGTEAGARWHIFSTESPLEPIAAGIVIGQRESNWSFSVEEFYPSFRIDEESGMPENASQSPDNPAARIGLFSEGQPVSETWLFFDPELAGMVPPTGAPFTLRFEDIQVPREVEMEDVVWNQPGAAMFVIGVHDKQGALIAREKLTVGATSEERTYSSGFEAPVQTLGTEGQFEVRVVAPTQRFQTALSVVSEPTVFWTNLGVGIVVFGALLTFIFRYRALYGRWDEERKTLSLALVPRWGQSPVQAEFDDIVRELSHGKGPVSGTGSQYAGTGENVETDRVRPEVVEV